MGQAQVLEYVAAAFLGSDFRFDLLHVNSAFLCTVVWLLPAGCGSARSRAWGWRCPSSISFEKREAHRPRGELRRVDRAVSVGIVPVDDFHEASSAESLQEYGRRVCHALLGRTAYANDKADY